MNPNEALILRFYTCFQNKDYYGMQASYAENATFTDDVFIDLNAAQARAMWEMLIKSGKDLSLEFSNIHADGRVVRAQWTATYTFSRTGNKVINKITSEFVIANGKIVKHTDSFNFYTWAKQAFGITGLLLGATSYFRNKIRRTALENLAIFMAKNPA
ncbi:MAG: nuclear transport factor 2 family protein [Bacteroidota bacterium]